MATRAFHIKTLSAATATVAALSLAHAAQAQDLAGAQVTVAGYCCTSPPGAATQVTNALTQTVGPGTEFPTGSFTSLTSGLAPLPVAIDVGTAYIELNYSAGGAATAGGFNGFVFSFANAPAITGATLDPASTYAPAVTFSGNQVFVNEAGLNIGANSMAMIDLTTAGTPTPPVPEPETFALLLAGLGVLGMRARWRG
ncbi:PEP-CTERM sorting domain-containing protein [Massilia sp. 9096]|uniref:PEP-CTERM sorting domain-containing protein n=1 Tax=Massilia sp. 9096 TaxID=1500894 RepID=UPI0009DD4209|nr:PEP-CTERM sorting domain-containing protein [Massilia sp. 9096]